MSELKLNSELRKETGKGVVELVREKGLLSEEQISEILAPERMAKPGARM